MFKRPTVRIVGRLEKKNWGLRPSKLHFPYAPGKSSPPPASLRSACCRATGFAPLRLLPRSFTLRALVYFCS